MDIASSSKVTTGLLAASLIKGPLDFRWILKTY